MNKLKELTLQNLQAAPQRISESHKYTYGSLLVIGGSLNYMGAPQLAAQAAFKCGVGLVSIALPAHTYFKFEQKVLSAIIFPFFTKENIKERLDKFSAVVFGPGLDIKSKLHLQVLEMLLESKIPLLIDASGLHLFKKVAAKFDDLSQVVITPHLGEATTLLDGLDPLSNYELLIKDNLTLVLKGSKTLIANSSECLLATKGSAALAKAGMGDVLSGIIGALLAQGYKPLEAAKLGVYIQQSAHIIALETSSPLSLMSEDIISSLPTAWNKLIAAQNS